MITESLQAIVKDSNHLICQSLVDVAEPVLDVQPHHLLHHALMGNASWITIGIGVTQT